MPETGFSPARLRTHLRKWIGLYLAATAALCLLNQFVFSVTRPVPSQAQTLRIMVMNTEFAPDREQLLAELQAVDENILALELEALPGASRNDSASVMLFVSKLVADTGDVYVTDSEGLALLEMRGAVTEYLVSGETYIAAVTQEARAFLSVIADEIKGD